jgi:hypothetical protein
MIKKIKSLNYMQGHWVTAKICMKFICPIYAGSFFSFNFYHITPCLQLAHPHNPQLAEPCLFSPIDHPARPIGCGGSNQSELLASPDSPSPCA